MSLTNIVDHLAEITEFSTVLSPNNNRATIDTSVIINAIIAPVMDNKVFAVHRNSDGRFPNATYSLVSSQPHYINENKICHIDTYVVSIRDKTYATILASVNSIITAFAESAYSVEITDKLESYEHDEKCFRVDLEVSIGVPSSDSLDSLPALFIYLMADSANESDLDNQIRQRITSNYGLVVLTNNNDLPELRQVVMNKLLGYQQTPQHWEMQYSRGSPASNQSGLQIWQDIYYDSVNTTAT